MRLGVLAILFALGGCAATGAAGLSPSAMSSAGIDFGIDSGEYATDGECDDPRFLGPGASGGFADYEGRDATDCRAAWEANRVAMLSPTQIAARSFTGVADGVDFGDNSGSFPNDGECDDPRFTGVAASSGFEDEELRDAADCYLTWRAGLVRLLTEEDIAARNFTGVAGGVDFGDNSGAYARDGECDDPRFTGPAAYGGLDDHELRDAADCYAGWRAGDLEFDPDGGALQDIMQTAEAANLEFGDDSGVFANDGECDDPRFEGAGLSGDGLESHVQRDASDCRAAYEAGAITLRAADELAGTFFGGVYDGIDFGDNSGGYARDGECDDPRFTGPGASGALFTDTNTLTPATARPPMRRAASGSLCTASIRWRRAMTGWISATIWGNFPMTTSATIPASKAKAWAARRLWTPTSATTPATA